MKNAQGKQNIGIIGGTFNPIHIGHLRSAEEVREAFGLKRVIFIPSASPPHKESSEIIDAHHRYIMVKKAIVKNPHFIASDVEIKRKGTSYTIDTLRHFTKRNDKNMKLSFIMGVDAFLEIETWKDFQRLFEFADFIVTDRPDQENPNPDFTLPETLRGLFEKRGDDSLIHRSGHRVYYHNISALDISSTTIRAMIQNGESIRYLVTDSVKRYIEKKGLYC
jgi:nicotinate-nucleotide adenylyltransferase